MANLFIFGFFGNLINRLLDFVQWLRYFREPIQVGNPRDPSKLEISVKSSGGRTILATIDKTSSVADVKRKLGPRLCPPSDDPESMRVIFAGKELSDHVKMGECDLGPKSTIHVVFGRRRLGRRGVPEATTSPLPELLATTLAEAPSGSLEEDVSSLLDEEIASENSEELEESSHRKNVVSFFVLCSGGVCPGKLRVRCDSCKEGAVTVLRDPESWDDVLHRHRINAVCENRSCPSSLGVVLSSSPMSSNPSQPVFAEFYFKCGEHAARDANSDAPPLPLVRQNARNVPCLGCTGVENPVFVFPCTFGHVTCIGCFVAYSNSRLNDRRFVVRPDGYSVCCPVGCADSWVTGNHYFKLLGKEHYERYQRFAAEDFVLSSGGTFCPQPDCGMGLLPPPESSDGCGDVRRIVCDREGGCGFVFCRECRLGYHIGPCLPDGSGGGGDVPSAAPPPSSFASGFSPDRVSRSAWEAAGDSAKDVSAVRRLTKPCPNCRVATERDGGCMHITCRCGYNWCWVCQAEWTRECMASHWF